MCCVTSTQPPHKAIHALAALHPPQPPAHKCVACCTCDQRPPAPAQTITPCAPPHLGSFQSASERSWPARSGSRSPQAPLPPQGSEAPRSSRCGRQQPLQWRGGLPATGPGRQPRSPAAVAHAWGRVEHALPAEHTTMHAGKQAGGQAGRQAAPTCTISEQWYTWPRTRLPGGNSGQPSRVSTST
jgi:hypothetical protein